MKGYVHSIESFGTVDGPGVRYVVFLQGCPLRCLYCHNPDTWELNKGHQMEVSEILDGYKKCRSFLKSGGITVTGGEPLMQLEFVTELFREARKQQIHTCIDTSGITYHEDDPDYLSKLDLLISYTDLVLLDIKHINSQKHKYITGSNNENILKFANYLDWQRVPVWIRHVVVPTLTQDERDLYSLGYFLGSLHNIKALDVLPYHDMGKTKYKQLGIEYPLEDILSLDQESAITARNQIIEGMKDRIQNKSPKYNSIEK